MITFLKKLQSTGNLGAFFHFTMLALTVIFGVLLWRLRPRRPESNFRIRESDLKRSSNIWSAGTDPLAQSRIPRREPLKLSGIRIDGAPHEILGIPSNSTAAQIQQAYRELMKRYHPDKIGPQDTREWKDAQKIAEALNRAKQEMLKQISRSD